MFYRNFNWPEFCQQLNNKYNHTHSPRQHNGYRNAIHDRYVCILYTTLSTAKTNENVTQFERDAEF